MTVVTVGTVEVTVGKVVRVMTVGIVVTVVTQKYCDEKHFVTKVKNSICDKSEKRKL